MNTQTQNQTTDTKLPRELRAVLRIFNADDELKRKALPHVNIDSQSVDWLAIWANDFGGGHTGAIVWAQALWADQVETKADPFDRAFALDGNLQRACIEALAVRWGLVK
jgi:hypothetical protein